MLLVLIVLVELFQLLQGALDKPLHYARHLGLEAASHIDAQKPRLCLAAILEIMGNITRDYKTVAFLALPPTIAPQTHSPAPTAHKRHDHRGDDARRDSVFWAQATTQKRKTSTLSHGHQP